MLRIEGDGSWQHTLIWRDDVPVKKWNRLVIRITNDGCLAAVDGEPVEAADRVILSGIYMLDIT